jgi:hypothetical protein
MFGLALEIVYLQCLLLLFCCYCYCYCYCYCLLQVHIDTKILFPNTPHTVQYLHTEHTSSPMFQIEFRLTGDVYQVIRLDEV